MSRLLSLFIVLSLVSSSAEAGRRYALVVGVKSYRAGQPLPDLPYAENDAKDLAVTLQSGGYQVTLMTQSGGQRPGHYLMNPTSDLIRDQINALLRNPFLRDDDVVIVALAGHGVQFDFTKGKKAVSAIDLQSDSVEVEFVNDGPRVPHFYFCPADADIRGLQSANKVADRHRLIDLEELYKEFQQCKAGSKLLLVDACRNDPSKPGITRSVASKTLPALPPPTGGTAAFFSCSEHQRAFEDADLKHGVFFHHVIQGLKGEADSSTSKRAADGVVTLSELSQFVCVETYDFVRKKFQGEVQAPELKGEFRVEIPLLIVHPATRKNAVAPAMSTAKPVVHELIGTWRQEADIGSGWSEVGKFRVSQDLDGVLYMDALTYGTNMIRSQGITNIKLSENMWTFKSDWGSGDVAEFRLKKQRTNLFEGAAYLRGRLHAKNRWTRISQ